MCCLRFSKTIFPFAVTFILGIALVSVFNCFTSAKTKQVTKVNKTKTYIKFKSDVHCKFDKKTNIYSLQKRKEKIIVKPTLVETIIINEKTKQSNK